MLSHIRLFATPWTVAYQSPLSMEFSRQEYWSGLPFPSPGDLPHPGMEPRSPALQADVLPSEPPGKSHLIAPGKKANTTINFTGRKQSRAGRERGPHGRRGGATRESHTPEVLHELPELVHPPGQRHDDVDQCAGHVQLLLLHLHDGAERPEQDQASELVLVVPSERELIQRAFIPLCAVDPCKQT